MAFAFSSLVCACALACCQGPPSDVPVAPLGEATVQVFGEIEIDGIRFGELAPSSGIAIASDDPRLPHLKSLGLVKRSPARSWGCEQATGAPDTEGAGDIRTAWASATQDDQDEWLELTYAEEVKPVEVHVIETYNPGALFKVTAATGDMEAVLWKGEDPTPRDAGRGTSIVKVSAALKTNKIRIHLASKDVPGWNEIDTVGIVDEAGKTHWPISATASSNYAGGAEPGWTIDAEAAVEKVLALEKEVEELRAKLRSP